MKYQIQKEVADIGLKVIFACGGSGKVFSPDILL